MPDIQIGCQSVPLLLLKFFKTHPLGDKGGQFLSCHRSCSGQTVLVLQMEVEMGNDPQNRHFAHGFENTPPLRKGRGITTEIVDDDPSDESALLGAQQRQSAVQSGKYAAPSNV